jgi:hypothetical protein
MDLNDDSMPVPDEAPVSRRTRLSLALASVLPAACGSIEASASESRVRRDTGASSGTGMLSSFRSFSALGAAPMYADPPVLAGVISPCHEGPAAGAPAGAGAPAVFASMVASLSEATVASTAGAGAAAMAA